MPENANPQPGDTQVPANPPVAEAQDKSSAQPPVGENPAQTQPEKSVPYPRFKEVIDLKNGYENKIKELESELARRNQPVAPKSAIDQEIEDLVREGMDEKSAKILVNKMDAIARKSVDERVQPIERYSAQREVSDWTERFAQTHKDYAELEPKMYEVYTKLDPQTQEFLVSNPKLLEFLYSHVKSGELEKKLQEKFEEGQDSAYKGQGLKKALSGTSGASPKPKGLPTPEEIARMSLDEYRNAQKEILANLDKISRMGGS